MAGMNSTWSATHLERSTIWTDMIKEVLLDQLDAQQWVNWMPWEEGSGTTKKIASVGQLSVSDVTEEVPIPETRADTGNFDFTINEYVGNKIYFTDEMKEDSHLAQKVISETPSKMLRAIEEKLETDILAIVNDSNRGGQTLNDANTINGVPHRFAGGNAGTIELDDIFAAKMILKKANVPLTNMVGIVPPEVAFIFETLLTTSGAVSYNPMWEGVIESGLTSGMRFVRNIAGFDLYESNYLPSGGASETAFAERDGSTTQNVAAGKVCQFFSAASPDVTPYLGAWLRTPTVESWRDNDKRAEFYQMTARYGLKIWRPESIVSVVSKTAVL